MPFRLWITLHRLHSPALHYHCKAREPLKLPNLLILPTNFGAIKSPSGLIVPNGHYVPLRALRTLDSQLQLQEAGFISPVIPGNLIPTLQDKSKDATAVKEPLRPLLYLRGYWAAN